MMNEQTAENVAARLSKTQRRAMLADRAYGENAYSLRVSLATLRALEKRGLVSGKRGLGSMAFPHTSIMWPLTPLGLVVRRVLQEQTQ